MSAAARPRPGSGLRTGLVLFFRILWANPLTLFGFLLVSFLGLVALAVTVLPGLIPYGAQQFTGAYNAPPSSAHWFGTDGLSYDIFSNTLRALPLDLGIGVFIAGVSLVLGGLLGLVAGYWDRPGTLGGWTSTIILRVTDIFLSFPSLVLALAITASLGRGTWQVILAIFSTWWPYYVRLTRGEVLAVKNLPYVTAARAAGVRETRILFRHVVRNILDPLVVYFTMDIGTVLVVFSTIAFVANGIKYPGPTPEWGSMISYYQDFLLTQPWTVLAPGIAVFVTVIAFSLLGDGLRDVLDPRTRRAVAGGPVAPAPAAEPGPTAEAVVPAAVAEAG